VLIRAIFEHQVLTSDMYKVRSAL